MKVNLIVALACEARPLISHFGLEAAPGDGAYRAYRGENVSLVVSGVGKTAATRATAYWNEFLGGPGGLAWLNVGVGGHASEPIGRGFLAHKVVDSASGRSGYPALVFDPPGPTAAVMTVDRMEERYEGEWIYDMEASGFYETASRLSTAELVHCYKIVSDNAEAPPREVSAKRVTRLVEQNIESIDSVIGNLAGLVDELGSLRADPADFREYLGRWHFTATEREQLRRLLRRRATLAIDSPGEVAEANELAGLTRGSDVLRFIEQRLDSLPVTFP